MDSHLTLIYLTVYLGCVVKQAILQRAMEYRITEELAPDIKVADILSDSKLHTKHPPSVLNSLSFSLRITNNRYKGAFVLDAKSGILRTAKQLDRESLCPREVHCSVDLDVTVRPTQYFQIIKVRVFIQDINDNEPVFPQNKITFNVAEGQLPGLVGIIPPAVDTDSGNNGIQGYKLLSNIPEFKINNDQSGSILLESKKSLDREKADFHKLRVLAHDGGIPRKSGSIIVEVIVEDINDNRPIFENSTYSKRVLENVAIFSPLLQVKAHDADSGVNGQIKYKLSEKSAELYGDLFDINSNTGIIVLKSSLTYHQQSTYDLSVIAIDKGPKAVPVAVRVTIYIVDVNNHAPEIAVHDLTPSGEVEIIENAGTDAFVAHISVSDQDGGENGNFDCSLAHTHFLLRSIYATEYKIVTATNIDREKQSLFTITINCVDHGKPAKKAFQRIRISVRDTNDNPPVFSQNTYFVKIKENNRLGETLVRINATDRDLAMNARMVFSLRTKMHSLLDISPSTGHIFAKAQFDRERQQDIEAVVFVSDQGSPPLTSSASVVISIIDVNDEGPRFSQPSYGFHILQAQPAGTEVGKVYATDADSAPYNRIRYSIKSKQPVLTMFAIDSDSGTIRTTDVLTTDNTSVYHLIVIASDVLIPKLKNATNVSIYVVPEGTEIPLQQTTLFGLSGYNWLIILSLSGALIATVIILVIVIVCYTRRRHRTVDRRGYISGNLVRVSNRDGDVVRGKGELGDGIDRLPEAWGTLLDLNMAPFLNQSYSPSDQTSQTYVQSSIGPQTPPAERNASLQEKCASLRKSRHPSCEESPRQSRIEHRPSNRTGKSYGSKPQIVYNKAFGMRSSRSREKELERTGPKTIEEDDSDSDCSADVSNSDSAGGNDEIHRHKGGRGDGSTYHFPAGKYRAVDHDPDHKKNRESLSSPDSDIYKCRPRGAGNRDQNEHPGISESSGASSGMHKVALVHPQRNGKRGTDRLSLSDSCQGQYGSSFEEEQAYAVARGPRESELEGDSDTGSSDRKDEEPERSSRQGPQGITDKSIEEQKEPGNPTEEELLEEVCLNDTDFYESDNDSRSYNIMV